MDQVLSFLRGMAEADRSENMGDALSGTGDRISADDMGHIIRMYLHDLCTFLDGLPDGGYRTTVRGRLLDSGLLRRLLTTDLSHDMDAADVVSYLSSYGHLCYNRMLNAVLIGVHHGERIPPAPSRNLVFLWAIYNLFVRGVLTGGETTGHWGRI